MKYKYKVCVYAIAKNESQFVDRWYNSVKEADEIYVLDTGSEDDTVDKLISHGINVEVEKIVPWRFDVARNKALELVPEDADICVSVDLDEVYEPGWRKKIEESWQEDTTRLRHTYNWKVEDGKPVVTFYYEKTHARKGYKWTHPVHEILSYSMGEEKIVTNESIILNHFPDPNKSRSNYLPLLELSVKENPEDDRNMHYLGREYMYYGKYEKCIDTLIKHLQLKKATWKDERSASMRFIARSYKSLGRLDEARLWLSKAKKETPYLREPYVESGILEYDDGKYEDAIRDFMIALNIKNKYKNYINEPFCYDGTVYDYLSICKYNLGMYAESLYYLDIALKHDPKNERLINNKKIIEKILND